MIVDNRIWNDRLMTSRFEYEANLFTAELTLPDDKTIKLIRDTEVLLKGFPMNSPE